MMWRYKGSRSCSQNFSDSAYGGLVTSYPTQNLNFWETNMKKTLAAAAAAIALTASGAAASEASVPLNAFYGAAWSSDARTAYVGAVAGALAQDAGHDAAACLAEPAHVLEREIRDGFEGGYLHRELSVSYSLELLCGISQWRVGQ